MPQRSRSASRSGRPRRSPCRSSMPAAHHAPPTGSSASVATARAPGVLRPTWHIRALSGQSCALARGSGRPRPSRHIGPRGPRRQVPSCGCWSSSTRRPRARATASSSSSLPSGEVVEELALARPRRRLARRRGRLADAVARASRAAAASTMRSPGRRRPWGQCGAHPDQSSSWTRESKTSTLRVHDMTLRLQGKTALVTGSTSNIGRAIALAFAAEGAHVVVSGPRRRPRRRGRRRRSAAAGGRADFVAADLDGSAAASRGSGRARPPTLLGGRLDILVNNAGHLPRRHHRRPPTRRPSTASTRVNVKAPFFLTAALAPAMIERGGGVDHQPRLVDRPARRADRARSTARPRARMETLTRAWAAEFGPQRRPRQRDLTRRDPHGRSRRPPTPARR